MSNPKGVKFNRYILEMEKQTSHTEHHHNSPAETCDTDVQRIPSRIPNTLFCPNDSAHTKKKCYIHYGT